MNIQELFERAQREIVTLDDLRAIANDRHFGRGDDAIAIFQRHADHCAEQNQALLTRAETEQRDLHASESREFDRHLRAQREVRSLLVTVEERTQTHYRPPVSQRLDREPAPEPPGETSVVLDRETRMLDHVRSRGVLYAEESRQERLSLGRIVAALALGRHDGVNALERRVMSEGVDALGGFATPEILSAQLIDRVRNMARVFQAGARTVPLTSDVTHLARVASDPSVAWKSENDPITEGDVTLERVTFTARTLPALVRLSVELSEDAPNIAEAIENSLARTLALELDRAALLGSGTAPEPTGVENQTGVTTEAAVGTPADYGFLVTQIGSIWGANFAPTARIYSARTATTLAGLTETNGQPLQAPPAVANVPELVTNQVPNNRGAGTNESLSFVGDFTQLLIGMRTSFRLEVSREAGSAFGNLQILVRAYLRSDVQLAHPEAFSVAPGITP